jgi:hypothetical protein
MVDEGAAVNGATVSNGSSDKLEVIVVVHLCHHILFKVVKYRKWDFYGA